MRFFGIYNGFKYFENSFSHPLNGVEKTMYLQYTFTDHPIAAHMAQ
jgi:hypothetical protein